MDKAYERINWQDEPSVETPIDATNLNKMDEALDVLDNRVVELDIASQVAKGNIDSLIENMSTAEKDIVTLKQLLNSAQGAIANVGIKVTEAEADIGALQAVCDTKAQGIICTASGEVVVITDCSDAVFSNISVNGASKQDKIIGKNHLNVTANTITKNGITATINADKSISISGSSNARVEIDLNYGESGDELDGTYYLTGTNEVIFISAVVNGVDVPSTTDRGAGVQVTFDKSVGPNKNWIRLSMSEEIAIYDEIVIYPLLRKCDENGNPIGDDTYEPYTVLGPSLESHQPIKSVGDSGSLEIITRTNNLYSGGDQTFTQRKTIQLEKPLPAGRYTVSAFVESTDTDSTMSALGFVGGATNGGQIYARLTRGERVSSTQTIYNTVSTIWILASSTNDNGAGDTATWTDVQIEAGETATPYQPYKYDSITIPLSEPLRKYDKIVKQDGVWGIERGTKPVPFGGTWQKRAEYPPNDGSTCYSSANFITDNVAKADMYMACTHLLFGGTTTGIADIETFGRRNTFFKFYNEHGSASVTGTTMYVCVDAPTLEDFMAEMEGAIF